MCALKTSDNITERIPLAIQFEFHAGSAEARQMAHDLERALNADEASPGLYIQTSHTRLRPDGEPPQATIIDDADTTVVVLLSEDLLGTDQQLVRAGPTWAEYARDLHEMCKRSGNVFFPVQLTPRGYPVDASLARLNFLRAYDKPEGTERIRFVLHHLIERLIRCLRGAEHANEPTCIFLSHAKVDFDQEPRVARAIAEHLGPDQANEVWYDTGDIVAGSEFEKRIEDGVQNSSLMAIATDSYSSRAWCRREVLLAKKYKRPTIIVDAIQRQELRRFPYAGNVPVIRWTGSSQDVHLLLLRETLRHEHALALLQNVGQPGDAIISSAPELLSAIPLDPDTTLLYPDPPLGPEELSILDAAGIKATTPLQRMASGHASLSNLHIALSISDPDDAAEYGVGQEHIRHACLELSRYLLVAGVRLAYGGHLGPDGYTLRLAHLLSDPIIQGPRGGDQRPRHKHPLGLYVAWPTEYTAKQRAALPVSVAIHACKPPNVLGGGLDIDELPERLQNALGLTAMREQQTTETNARIILGGNLGKQSHTYQGRLPGVIEEALTSLQQGQPLYVVGGFGGCGGLLADLLNGSQRDEWSRYGEGNERASQLRAEYLAHGMPWEEPIDWAHKVTAGGLAALSNGLDEEENRELMTTRRVDRIVDLIIRGLARLDLEQGD